MLHFEGEESQCRLSSENLLIVFIENALVVVNIIINVFQNIIKANIPRNESTNNKLFFNIKAIF